MNSSPFMLVLGYEVAKVPRSDFLTPQKSSADMVTSNNKILSMQHFVCRFHWEQVIRHPFWSDGLKHLSGEPETDAINKHDTDLRCATPLTKR